MLSLHLNTLNLCAVKLYDQNKQISCKKKKHYHKERRKNLHFVSFADPDSWINLVNKGSESDQSRKYQPL